MKKYVMSSLKCSCCHLQLARNAFSARAKKHGALNRRCKECVKKPKPNPLIQPTELPSDNQKSIRPKAIENDSELDVMIFDNDSDFADYVDFGRYYYHYRQFQTEIVERMWEDEYRDD